MTKTNQAFTIDDTLSPSDNLAAYAQVLEAIDAPLEVALRPYLAVLVASQTADTAVVWDALYAAIAAIDPGPTSPSDGTGCAEVAA